VYGKAALWPVLELSGGGAWAAVVDEGDCVKGRRLSRRKVRLLEREGVLGFLRPVGPRPPERPRKPRQAVQRRQRRAERPLSIAAGKELTRVEKFDRAVDEWGLIADGVDQRRPERFSDCKRGPCPWVSCRYHLYLDVNEQTGAIKINHPGKEPWELKQTCARRIGRRVLLTGQETPVRKVAKLMNVTDERVRQIEGKAISKLKVLAEDVPNEALRALLTGGR
jgi:hypothetical protein